ncbi:HAD-like domain-containing protein [Chaetomium strumarium]|uniref:HAD-like domain-containing protein n=1 Tax=Chaetomium strumarium TaxID=1170767 RepID=A0AAJ0GTA8_9PEZI|nr:HAD-like domain-containing protein [Chaetomium strumarium]
MSTAQTIIAFDLYGTLLSTDSVTGELAKLVDDGAAKELSTLWRRYQLEYTWRINSMGHYCSFSDITRASLLHAAAEMKLSLTSDDVGRAMEAYDALRVFPDVPPALEALSGLDSSEAEAYIFSNGTGEVLKASVYNSPDLKPYASAFRKVVSVEDVEVFKPDRKAYDHLLKGVGRVGAPGDVWLVSSNPFDALGAVAAGLKSCWIDRARTGWIDRLGSVIGENMRPTLVASSVGEAVQMILKRQS